MVDASERLQVLSRQEATTYRTIDYLSRIREDEESLPPSPKRQRSNDSMDESRSGSWGDDQSSPVRNRADNSGSLRINKHWREKICEWAYQVVDHFDIQRETVSVATNYLDRYLADYAGPVDKNLFQLLAMTCLYMAIKLNFHSPLVIENPRTNSSMETVLQLSRGYFTLEEMEKMEREILQRLQWRVSPPTSQLFVKHFIYTLGIQEREISDLAHFIVELAVMDYFFVSYLPSEVATAAILEASKRLLHSGAYYDSLHLPLSFKRDSANVQACRDRLALIYDQAVQAEPAMDDQFGRAKETTGSISPVSVMTSQYSG